jgi:UDP-glucose 4-epimerase
VTGGAGYIGSHTVRALLSAGHVPVVLDDLSTGHRDAVPSGVAFYEVQLGDSDGVSLVNLDTILGSKKIEAVMHFAARIDVAESILEPRICYESNLGASIAIANAMVDNGVNLLVFSSTAAVYGDPLTLSGDGVPIDETRLSVPVSPYGETKLAAERMFASYARAYGLRVAMLRYFNAAGADPDAGLGERHEPETHLIPRLLHSGLGRGEPVTIYGTDYETPDGTAVRDYVHVLDLAEAHVRALEYLAQGGENTTLNLGTGVGHSVREVLEVTRRVRRVLMGRPIEVRTGPRREGDPAVLVASVEKAARVLGWRATRSLEDMVRDAWRFHSKEGAR